VSAGAGLRAKLARCRCRWDQEREEGRLDSLSGTVDRHRGRWRARQGRVPVL